MIDEKKFNEILENTLRLKKSSKPLWIKIKKTLIHKLELFGLNKEQIGEFLTKVGFYD